MTNLFLPASPGKALPILRITITLFMLVWTLEKFIRPEAFVAIFGYFYGLSFGPAVVYALGAAQLALLAAFALGLFKTISYGAVTLMNLASLLVSLPLIFQPYVGETNHLFVASIPVFGACMVLFLLRDQGTWLTAR